MSDQTPPDFLEHHRALLEKAQEVAHVGSWMADLDGSERVHCSEETRRIFGVPAEASLATFSAFLSHVHPDDRDAARRAGQAAVRDGLPFDVEHRIVRPDGSVRWVHQKADVVRDPGGVALRMVGTVHEITERRRLEEQLRQSQKLEAIGRLAGGIAHDINNALTAIVGYTELALGSLAEDHPAAPDVVEIRRAAERAEAVTRQLLAFSRKQLLEPKVFSLADAVTSMGRLLERLLGNAVELQILPVADVPPIYGDPGQIEQAIVNLAVNACDAMPDGGRLTLSLALREVDEAFARANQPMPVGPFVELSVADTGQGMAPETRAHVFEPFYTTKEAGKGTGLGLAMVYGTVKQSGGFIFVESQEGVGTTFRLYFPPAPASARSRQPAPPAKGATLLVVEDEKAVRRLVVTALRGQGYQVLEAESGEEALRIAERASETIDLLLTDANMPGMSGIEVANTLVGLVPELRVVIMSGYTAEALTVQGLPGPVSLLSKPFTPKELSRKVADILAGR